MVRCENNFTKLNFKGTIEERLAVQNANRASVSNREVVETEHQVTST